MLTRPSEPETSFPGATNESKSTDASTGKNVTPLVLDPDDPKTNPWTVMDTLKAIEAEESLRSDKIEMLKNRREMAKTLDQQMSIEGKLARQKKREDDEYLAQQQRMLNEWKREQQVRRRFAGPFIMQEKVPMRSLALTVYHTNPTCAKPNFRLCQRKPKFLPSSFVSKSLLMPSFTRRTFK